MAVADIGNVNFPTSTATNTVNVTSAVASGTLVVVCVFDGNSAITGTTVTDSKSNTYIKLTSINPTGGLFGLFFYSFITSALTTSDTFSYNNAATGSAVNMIGVSATGYNAIDPATTNTASNGFAATYSVTGAGPAAVANEIYFGFVVAFNPPSTPTGWSINPPTSPNTAQLEAYQINSGTSALTFNGTLTSQWAGSIIASFKPGSSGGGPAPLVISTENASSWRKVDIIGY